MNKNELLFDKELSLFRAAIMGGVIGLVYVIWLFPIDFLSGIAGFWQHGDPGSHVSALQLFMSDDWHYPPLETNYLNYPQGVNIAFADVIPLAAILIKPFFSWLPDGFHYFGYWIVFSYFLQGVAAGILLWMVGVKNWSFVAVGVFFFLLSPAMLFRAHAHIALTTHGIILLSLCVYFYLVINEGERWKSSAMISILNCCALLIHPYFLAMVVPIYLAGLFDRARSDRKFAASFLALLISLVPVFILILIGGYLSKGVVGLSGGGGFTFNSMNLVAPFVGGNILDLPALQDASGAYGSLPMPYDATGGQFEGYNYLGLGILVAFIVAIVCHGRKIKSLVTVHLGIALLSAGFALYALSSAGFVAAFQLWRFDLPAPFSLITEQFRASGRFFWPVAYLILLVSLVGVIQAGARRLLALALLSLMLVIQFMDTRPLRDMTRAAAVIEPPFSIDDDEIKVSLAKADALYLFPAFGCGANPFEEVVPLQVLAAQSHIPFSTGLIARGFSSCEEKQAALDNGLSDHSAYVFLDAHFQRDDLVDLIGEESFRERCHAFKLGYFCRSLSEQ